MERIAINRRNFLKGATAIVGAASVGLPKITWAAAEGGTVQLSFWNGRTFDAAESLASGDRTLATVRLTIRSFGLGSITSLDVKGFAPAQGSSEPTSYRAWSTPPAGAAHARVIAAVATGLELLVTARTADGFAETPVRLTTGFGGQFKLREGTYLLTDSSIRTGALRLSQEGVSHGLEVNGSVPAQYLLITVERI